MKKSLFVSLFMALDTFVFAQLPTIHGHTLIPANPTPSSQIKIVTHLETSYSAFLVDKQFTATPIPQSIRLHLCYASGMTPVISHHIDTFAIGQLPAGVYPVQLEAYMSGAGQHCARIDSNFAAFTFTVSGIAGINESLLHHEIKIYPNPARDYIAVESAIKMPVRIYSVQGQLLRVREVNSSGLISLDGLTAGIYLLEVVSEKGRSMRRFIIQ